MHNSFKIPVGQPTNVNPYLVETASELERTVGKVVGDSNILIFLICLKLKSYLRQEFRHTCLIKLIACSQKPQLSHTNESYRLESLSYESFERVYSISYISKNRLTLNTPVARVHWLQPLTKSPHGSPRITALTDHFCNARKDELVLH